MTRKVGLYSMHTKIRLVQSPRPPLLEPILIVPKGYDSGPTFRSGSVLFLTSFSSLFSWPSSSRRLRTRMSVNSCEQSLLVEGLSFMLESSSSGSHRSAIGVLLGLLTLPIYLNRKQRKEDVGDDDLAFDPETVPCRDTEVPYTFLRVRGCLASCCLSSTWHRPV